MHDVRKRRSSKKMQGSQETWSALLYLVQDIRHEKCARPDLSNSHHGFSRNVYRNTRVCIQRTAMRS